MGGNNNAKFALLIPSTHVLCGCGTIQQNSGIWLGEGNHSTGQTLKTGLDEQLRGMYHYPASLLLGCWGGIWRSALDVGEHSVTSWPRLQFHGQGWSLEEQRGSPGCQGWGSGPGFLGQHSGCWLVFPQPLPPPQVPSLKPGLAASPSLDCIWG